MKRKTLAAILGVSMLAAVALTGCGAETATESGAPSSTVSQETPRADEVSEASSAPSDASSESSETSEAEGSFEAYFAENPLDEAYDQQMQMVVANTEMISAADTYAGLWDDEVTHGYDLLIQHAEGDEKTALEAEKNNWNASKTEKATNEARKISGDGSMVRVERAMRVKDFYREKAKEVYARVYQITPDFEFIYTPY